MGSNVVHLSAKKRAANERVQQLLEEIMDAARAGEVTGIAIATITSDCRVLRGHAGEEDYTVSLLGGLTALSHDLSAKL